MTELKYWFLGWYYGFKRLGAIVQPVRIRWMKLHPDAKNPTRAFQHDAAWDIHSTESMLIPAGGHLNVDVGLAVEVGPGVAYNVRGRSGLTRRGIIAGLGLCDSHYNGPLKVVLSNLSSEAYTVEKGERVAQIQFISVLDFPWQKVDSFKHKLGTRGTSGWGSSGRL